MAKTKGSIDLARLQALPEIMAQMVKPVEKIDSIRIHQIGGLGGASGAGAGGAQGDKPVVNQALDSIMGMAVQMPTLKKLGEELGLAFDGGLSGLADSALDTRPNGKPPEAIDGADGGGRSASRPAE